MGGLGMNNAGFLGSGSFLKGFHFKRFGIPDLLSAPLGGGPFLVPLPLLSLPRGKGFRNGVVLLDLQVYLLLFFSMTFGTASLFRPRGAV